MATRLVYEDDHVVAIQQDGDSEFVLVTFADRLHLENGNRFWADEPVRKKNISGMGIVARTPNWYPVQSMDRLAQAIAPRLARFKTRVGYGGSMGGYGVIKHSRRLDLTHVIALCPQWSIDRAECGDFEPGYQEYFRPEMAGHGVTAEDIAGRLVLVFDPLDSWERSHASRIMAAAADCVSISMPHIGHHVTSALAGSQNLLEMITAVIAGDIPRIRKLTSDRRRSNNVRTHEVLVRAARTHPGLAARALSHPLAGYNSPLGSAGEYLLPILEQMLRSGRSDEVQRTVHTIVDRCPNITDAMKLLLTRHELRRRGNAVPGRRIRTYHDSWIVYDPGRGHLRHATSDLLMLSRNDLIPVFLQRAGNRGGLFVLLGGERYDLDVDDRGFVRPVLVHRSMPRNWAGEWRIEERPVPAGSVSIALQGALGFMCAEDGGGVMVNRPTVSDWELFRLA